MAEIKMNRRSFLAAAAATAIAGGAAAALADEAKKDDAAASGAPAGGDYDIVVVGMGGAGMCAALAASEAGVEKIAILEKNAMEGGNTIFSSSGMNASETTYQKDQGIEDSTDLFIQETVTGGHNWNNVDLVTQMCEGSAAAIDWLANHGLVLDNITTTGGMSVPRCHRPTDGSAVGAAYVPAIAQAVTDAGIEVVYNCRATELVVDESGAVTGVVCEDGTLADCLSTAMFVLGPQAALNYWRTYGGFEMLLVKTDGHVVLTNGLYGQFTPNGDSYVVDYAS